MSVAVVRWYVWRAEEREAVEVWAPWPGIAEALFRGRFDVPDDEKVCVSCSIAFPVL